MNFRSSVYIIMFFMVLVSCNKRNQENFDDKNTDKFKYNNGIKNSNTKELQALCSEYMIFEDGACRLAPKQKSCPTNMCNIEDRCIWKQYSIGLQYSDLCKDKIKNYNKVKLNIPIYSVLFKHSYTSDDRKEYVFLNPQEAMERMKYKQISFDGVVIKDRYYYYISNNKHKKYKYLWEKFDPTYQGLWSLPFAKHLKAAYVLQHNQIDPVEFTTFLQRKESQVDHVVIGAFPNLLAHWSKQKNLGKVRSMHISGHMGKYEYEEGYEFNPLAILRFTFPSNIKPFFRSPVFKNLQELTLNMRTSYESMAKSLLKDQEHPQLKTFAFHRDSFEDVTCKYTREDLLVDAILGRQAAMHFESLIFKFWPDFTCDLDKAFEHLQHTPFPDLHTLVVQDYPFKTSVIHALFQREDLPSMTRLSLSSSSFGAGVFHDLPEKSLLFHLESLDLSYTKLQERDFPAPESCKGTQSQLKFLNVGANEIGVKGLSWFAYCGMLTQLTYLNLSGNNLSEDNWSKVMPPDHPKMNHLRVLELSGTQISLSGLQWFAEHGLDEVEELFIDRAQLNDEKLAFLLNEVKWKRLKTLSISYNKLTDKTLDNLVSSNMLKTLESLDIGGNKFTGESLQHVKGPYVYPVLRSLDIASNPWTVKGLAALIELPWFNYLPEIYLSLNDSLINVPKPVREKLSDDSSRPISLYVLDWLTDETLPEETPDTSYVLNPVLEAMSNASFQPQSLVLSGILTDEHIKILSTATWLKYVQQLSLSGSFTGESLASLVSKLDPDVVERLSLRSKQLDAKYLITLASHPNLKKLRSIHLSDAREGGFHRDVTLSWLRASLPNLTSISIDNSCRTMFIRERYEYASTEDSMTSEEFATALKGRQNGKLIEYFDTDPCQGIEYSRVIVNSDQFDPAFKEEHRDRIMRYELEEQKTSTSEHNITH